MLHNTIVTKQWTAKWPHECFFPNFINHGDKSYFRRFKGGQSPLHPGSAPGITPAAQM